MPELYSNSIFWIETDKIRPNPYQPRREFEEDRLRDLADSIRQYGVLQPLVVSRVEVEKEDGGLATEYELIAGERRLRASRIAGLAQVPAIIRVGDDSMMKLELAIIENLQREDLNAVDRARAFARLAQEFHFTHGQIGAKVGRSREYVSNTMRLLQLTDEILTALSQGKLTEGHTRPLLMLSDRPVEQTVLFKEIVYKRLSVREAERLARAVATDRVRKRELLPDPELADMQDRLAEALGTRVSIERKDFGGHIKIDFFSSADLRMIIDLLKSNEAKLPSELIDRFIAGASAVPETPTEEAPVAPSPEVVVTITQEDPRDPSAQAGDKDADLYNIKNFSI